MKRCTVAYALPRRQWLWTVDVSDGATVADVLERVRGLAQGVDVPWDAQIGIFGEPCGREAVPRDGDRIELYRPLSSDPKASRRARAAAGKAGAGQASARLPTSAPKKTR